MSTEGLATFDLSKRSTGWAYLRDGGDRAFHGCWEKIASEYTSRGGTFYKLYEELMGLHMVMPIRKIFAEDPVNILPNSVATNAESVRISCGMAATLEMFAYTIGAPLIWIHQASWRRHFLGKVQRGTKSTDLKLMAIEACKRLGLKPQKHDDAEALGLLDYACDHEGVTPPWRAEPPFQLTGGAA